MKTDRIRIAFACMAGFVAMAFSGCSGDEDRVCDPGATQPCTCTSGFKGAQSCEPSGKAWGSCVCDKDKDAGTDQTVRDAGLDVLTLDKTVADAVLSDVEAIEVSIPDSAMPDASGDLKSFPDGPIPDKAKTDGPVPDVVQQDLQPPKPKWTVAYSGKGGGHLYDIWGPSKNNLFAVGTNNALLRFNGVKWTASTIAGTTTGKACNTVWGTSAKNVFVGCQYEIAQYNGTTWKVTKLPTPNPNGYSGWGGVLRIMGTGATNVYAQCGNGILHFNGTKWAEMSGLPAYIKDGRLGYSMHDMWLSSSTNIYAVGEYFTSYKAGGVVIHNDGTFKDLKVTAADKYIRGVYGLSASSIFACGDSGRIIQKNGSVWSQMYTGITQTLRGIWGTSAKDLWAVGTFGVVLHYNGTSWKIVNTGTTKHWNRVWGLGGDVFVVGQDQTILRYGP